ncbi:hypothetical protein B0H16DRAFT_1898553 [Mycena metata]|uniref:Uncharacterized protein n=1 Tax=Mycena metata TaxID=1033252 RepID=A0AAD7MG25_9AGAR|nr:hypothetical protein B0H16DRAFT_1898553 [Mycena metata]
MPRALGLSRLGFTTTFSRFVSKSSCTLSLASAGLSTSSFAAALAFELEEREREQDVEKSRAATTAAPHRHERPIKPSAYPPDLLRQYSPAGSIGGNNKLDVIKGAEAVRDPVADGTTSLRPLTRNCQQPNIRRGTTTVHRQVTRRDFTTNNALATHNALASRGSFTPPSFPLRGAGGAGRKAVDFI